MRSRIVIALVLVAAVAAARGQQTYSLTDADTWQAQPGPDPDSPEGRLAEARAALAADQPARARSLADAWIKEHPNHPLLPEAHLVRGDALVAQGDYYESLYDYEFIARAHPASETFETALQRELDVASRFAHGTRRKFLGMRIVDASDEAEELLIRIQERLPGSELAERAAMELGDFYFRRRRMELAAEMYAIFLENYPRSHQVSTALKRLIYAHLATFKGPEFDASGLREARDRLEQLIDLEPATAQEAMADSLLTRIDESEARKLLITARWYQRRGDPVAAEFMIRRLVERFPRTVAARDALHFVQKVVPHLPAAILREMPDYDRLAEALLGAPPEAPEPATRGAGDGGQ